MATSLACSGWEDAAFGSKSAGTGSAPRAAGAPVVGPGTPTREVTLRWIPSTSSGVTRYDLSVGEASGAYASVVRIPAMFAARGSDGVFSYPLTVRSDVDLYLALRAIDSTRTSTLSNEIRIAAVTSLPQTFGGGGHAEGSASVGTGSLLAGGGSGRTVSAPPIGEIVPDREVTRYTATSGADADPSSGSEATSTAALASIDFDGQREYLANTQEAPLGTGGSFTLSMWLQPIVDRAPRRVLLDARAVATSEAERVTLSLLDGQDLELVVHDAEGGIALRARYALDPGNGAWQHLAIVFEPGFDPAPRVYLDLAACESLDAEPEAAFYALPDSRHVAIGGASDAPGESFLGRIGHVAVWDTVLPWLALAEVQGRGHRIDLRLALGGYASEGSLVHYWRLGDVGDVIGYDVGASARPLDLDDAAGDIAYDDIALDGPASIAVAASLP